MKRHDEEISGATNRNSIDRISNIHVNPYTSHPKLEYACDFCGLKYNTPEMLKQHMASNHSTHLSHSSRSSHLSKVDSEVIEIQDLTSGPKQESHVKMEKEIVIEEEEAVTKIEDEGADEQEKGDNVKRSKIEKQNRKENDPEMDSDVDLRRRSEYVRAHPHRPASNFTCDICHKVISTYYSMKLHMFSKHTQKFRVKHPCPTCKKEFVSRKRLEKHRKLKHSAPVVSGSYNSAPTEAAPTVTKAKQMCSVCGRLFPDRSKMLAHERTHLGILTSCDLCDKKFTHKSYLRKHISGVHAKERPFACGISGCDWRFSYQQCLKRHQARLHGMVTKENKCHICGKCFPGTQF